MLSTTDSGQQSFSLAANHPSGTPMYVHVSQASLACPADVTRGLAGHLLLVHVTRARRRAPSPLH